MLPPLIREVDEDEDKHNTSSAKQLFKHPERKISGSLVHTPIMSFKFRSGTQTPLHEKVEETPYTRSLLHELPSQTEPTKKIIKIKRKKQSIVFKESLVKKDPPVELSNSEKKNPPLRVSLISPVDFKLVNKRSTVTPTHETSAPC